MLSSRTPLPLSHFPERKLLIRFDPVMLHSTRSLHRVDHFADASCCKITSPTLPRLELWRIPSEPLPISYRLHVYLAAFWISVLVLLTPFDSCCSLLFGRIVLAQLVLHCISFLAQAPNHSSPANLFLDSLPRVAMHDLGIHIMTRWS